MSALSLASQHLSLTPNQEFLKTLADKYSGMEFTVEDLQADEDLTSFLTAKKAKKPKLSSHERASLDYNPEMCCARVWQPIKGKKGLAVQCTGTTGAAKEEGGLCNRCAKPNKFLWLGRMDGPMPNCYPEPVYRKPDEEEDAKKDAHFLMQDAEGKPIDMPVEEPKKKASKDSNGEPKKRGRKPGSKNKKKKSSVEEEQAAEIAKLKAMLEAKEHDTTPDLTHSEDEAAGVGLTETSEPVKEEEDEYESIVFEGVEYQRNSSDNTILNPEDFSVVGVWKDDAIEWEDDEAKEAHDEKKNE
jgi:hypothetical protein